MGEGVGGDEEGGGGVLGHGLEAGGGIRGVEGDVAGAGFQDGEEGDDELGGAVEAKGYGGAGMREEVTSQLVGASVELGVGQIGRGGYEGDGIRGGGGLGLEEDVNEGVARVVGRTALPMGGRHGLGIVMSLSHLGTVRGIALRSPL